jgi:hypothetical protein
MQIYTLHTVLKIEWMKMKEKINIFVSGREDCFKIPEEASHI